MKNEFVTYKQYVGMRELGFDFTSEYLYFDESKSLESGYIHVPLKQQAFKWFRERYEIDSYIHKVIIGSDEQEYAYTISLIPPEYREKKRTSAFLVDIESFKEGPGSYSGAWSKHEEAESACLDKLIEIVKQMED